MKILCVSDQIDPLVYSGAIKERFGDVDLVLCAGDLPLDYLDFIMSSLDKPLYFVFGNHHVEDMKRFRGNGTAWDEGRASGAVHAGSRIRREGGFIIAGLGGSMRYNRGENQFTNFEMSLEILKLLPGLLFNRIFRGRFLDILLTHAPPEGIHDRKDRCHRGFRPFLSFMRIFKPRFLIHGHIHLYNMSDLRTTV
ncbi:MAG: metallophosphoesterase, partial [Treponema sp.]|nr:metallophosphoesterase [Treponema sp.]